MTQYGKSAPRPSSRARVSRLVAGSLLAALVVFAVSGAQAAVVKFDVFGQFASPSLISFSGTLSLDLDTNKAVSADVTVPGFAEFNDVSGPTFLGTKATLFVSNGSGSGSQILDLVFAVPTPFSFAGFNGGPLTGGEQGTGIRQSGIHIEPIVTDLVSGSITPVPEPTTWAMILLGFVGLGLAAKGRRALVLPPSLAK
jgi:PEP-CTERM motif-containing protein